ncbi:transmembrane protein 184C-like [Tubulanus polymorphus]|uniref:transmembrane protein 184C-like n=1 Tax=Tubulanus polymorphus TaxID=672921 RepID=UPI003DA2B488
MDCCNGWRGWIRPLVVSIYFVILIIALPLSVWELTRAEAPPYVLAWFIGGIFVMLSIPISVWGILQHLIHYTKPILQKPLIRVLWMVPIYGLNSWFALMFPSAAIYLDTLRECYEAYAIYNFMTFLMNFLHSEFPNFEDVIANKDQVKHLCPICWFPPWPMGRTFINYCKHGVLQYTVLRPVTTIIALCCQWGGVYNEGRFGIDSAWSYLVVVNNISQIWALYCLLLFYTATKEELSPLNPVSKFFCVKAVVFATFWQSVLIAILANTGVIQSIDALKLYSVQEISLGLQDLLVCIEMFVAAIAHYFSFSYEPYVDPSVGSVPCCLSFMAMWDISDVRADVVEHVRVVGKGVSKRVPGRARRLDGIEEPVEETERTPLLHSINVNDEFTYAQTSNLLNTSSDSINRDLLSSTSSLQTGRASISDSMTNFLRLGSSVESGSDTGISSGCTNTTTPQTNNGSFSPQTTQSGLLLTHHNVNDIPVTVVRDPAGQNHNKQHSTS